MLIVADAAPGLIKAIEQCWPASDRQRCCVHRARNLYAKLPERERERVKQSSWQALDDAISESDAKQRLKDLVGQLSKGATPRRPSASRTIWTRWLYTCATHPDTAAGGDRRMKMSRAACQCGSLRRALGSGRAWLTPERSAGFGALALPRSVSRLVT
jgi:transposase-like protein